MSARPTSGAVAWALVGIQALLLVGLVVLPSDPGVDPSPAVRMVGTVLALAGAALGVVAAAGLGTSLTPSPLPTERSQLVTGGLYRWVRHPIYTGVLVLGAGLVLRSGSLLRLGCLLGLLALFTVKTRVEERALTLRYPDYAAYAARTGRFLPRIRPAPGEPPAGGR